MSLYILKHGTTEIQPFGVPGELCYGATRMSCGYIDQPEETARAYIKNPYCDDFQHPRLWRSGDLAVRSNPHTVTLLGRLTEQIKIDGHRIDPVEVQNAILHEPHVRSAKVICLASPSKGKSLVGCVVLKEATQHPDEILSAVRMTCLKHLPQSMVPSIWQIYDVFPTTVTGKTDFKALAKIAEDRAVTHQGPGNSDARALTQAAVSSIPSFSKSEVQLLEVITPELPDRALQDCTVQHMRHILSRTFIECGGTSLGALKAISKFRRSGKVLALSDFLGNEPLGVVAEKLHSVDLTHRSLPRSDDIVFTHSASSVLAGAPDGISLHPDNFEAIFPCTSFQCIALSLSLFSTKQYTVYQYLDLSSHDYTAEQIELALQSLMDQKPILRTVVVPAPGDWPAGIAEFKQRHRIGYRDFLQVVQKRAHFKFSEHYGASNPTTHYLSDVQQEWELGSILWRASYLERSKILMLNVHHALTDHWTSELMNKDLFALLSAQTGSALSPKCGSRFDMRHLMHQKSGALTADNRGSKSDLEESQDPDDFWDAYLTNARQSFVPEFESPALDWRLAMEQPHQSLSFPRTFVVLCQKHRITTGAFWHAIWSLTLAYTLERTGGEITYYRCSNNRESQDNGFEIEGPLCSNTPICVDLETGTFAQLAQKILADCLRTRPFQALFKDRFAEGGPLGLQRAYSNTIFNHIAFDSSLQSEEQKGARRFENLVPGYSYFSQHDLLCMLELTVLEDQNDSAQSTDVVVRSRLPASNIREILQCVEEIFSRVIATDGTVMVGSILSRS